MNRPEEATQRAIVRHLQQRLALPWVFFHIPNQRGTRRGWEQGILKAMGVRKGMPDLGLIGDGRIVFLECKSPRGVLSKDQRKAIADLKAAGAQTMVVRSVDEALEALTAMKVPMRGRVM